MLIVMQGGKGKRTRVLEKKTGTNGDKEAIGWSFILAFLIPLYFTYNYDVFPNVLSEHQGWLFEPISLIAAYFFKQIKIFGDVIDFLILPISVNSTPIQTLLSILLIYFVPFVVNFLICFMFLRKVKMLRRSLAITFVMFSLLIFAVRYVAATLMPSIVYETADIVYIFVFLAFSLVPLIIVNVIRYVIHLAKRHSHSSLHI